MNVLKNKTLRKIQIFWGISIGIGAYFGTYMMISDPSGIKFGMDPMLPYFQVLPFADKLFQNFLIPGILLLIINGLTNTISVIMLFRNNKYANLSGLLCGIILMLWILVQFVIFEFNILSTLYFIFGFLQALNGFLLLKRTSHFKEYILLL